MQAGIFLIFIGYLTAVFFLPNGWLVLAGVVINLLLMSFVAARANTPNLIWSVLVKTARILPFVLFTAVFNWWLDGWQAAFWIGLKLVIVCNATMIYAANKSAHEIAIIVSQVCTPLRYLGVRPDEIRILVSVALMMIPVFQKELREMKQACRAKGMSWNLATLKMVLQKTAWSLLIRVNQLEEGLMAKGCQIDE